MIVFTYLGFWFLDFMMLYGHRYMSLPLFAITVIYLIEYIKKGNSRPSLVKTIFFAICSLYFLVITIMEMGGGSYRYVSLPLFAVTVICLIEYIKKGESRASLVKTIFFALCSLFFLVMSIIKTPSGFYNHNINPPFESIYYYSIGVFATLLFVFLIDKTITSIIKYVRLPKTDNSKKKSLVFSIIWSVVSIIYFGTLLAFIYLLIIATGA